MIPPAPYRGSADADLFAHRVERPTLFEEPECMLAQWLRVHEEIVSPSADKASSCAQEEYVPRVGLEPTLDGV